MDVSAQDNSKRRLTFSPLIIVAIAAIVFASKNPQAHSLLDIIYFLAAVNFVHIGGFVLSALMAHAPIEEISLFFGKRLVSLIIRSVTISVGCIPGTGFVSFYGMSFTNEPSNGKAFRDLPLGWRLGVIASGPLMLFLASCLLIGSEAGLRSFSRAPFQFFLVLSDPSGRGQALLRLAFNLFREREFQFVTGLLFAKVAAFNFFPLPTLNGGQLVLELFRARLTASEKAAPIQLAGLFIVLSIALLWCVALGKFLLSRLLP